MTLRTLNSYSPCYEQCRICIINRKTPRPLQRLSEATFGSIHQEQALDCPQRASAGRDHAGTPGISAARRGFGAGFCCQSRLWLWLCTLWELSYEPRTSIGGVELPIDVTSGIEAGAACSTSSMSSLLDRFRVQSFCLQHGTHDQEHCRTCDRGPDSSGDRK